MQSFAKKYPLARMAFDLASDSEGIKVALEQRAERLKKYYELMHGRCHRNAAVSASRHACLFAHPLADASTTPLHRHPRAAASQSSPTGLS